MRRCRLHGRVTEAFTIIIITLWLHISSVAALMFGHRHVAAVALSSSWSIS